MILLQPIKRGSQSVVFFLIGHLLLWCQQNVFVTFYFKYIIHWGQLDSGGGEVGRWGGGAVGRWGGGEVGRWGGGEVGRWGRIDEVWNLGTMFSQQHAILVDWGVYTCSELGESVKQYARIVWASLISSLQVYRYAYPTVFPQRLNLLCLA